MSAAASDSGDDAATAAGARRLVDALAGLSSALHGDGASREAARGAALCVGASFLSEGAGALSPPGTTARALLRGVLPDVFAPARLAALPRATRIPLALSGAVRTALAELDPARLPLELLGAALEATLAGEARGRRGVHYTAREDALRIVRPTLTQPWRAWIEEAASPARLQALRAALAGLRILDPACGGGNFLIVALSELAALDRRVVARLIALGCPVDATPSPSAANLIGLDVDPWALAVADVAVALAAARVGLSPAAPTLVGCDALLDGDRPRAWPRADVIVGNPPFCGAKRLAPRLGPDYVARLRRCYPDVSGLADLCAYFFHRAHEQLPRATAALPHVGRAGLVGTRNIRARRGRAGGLDRIARDGAIVEAVDSLAWSGDATVHVAVVCWIKTDDLGLAPRRRLWSRGSDERGPLRPREVARIDADLSEGTHAIARRLACNVAPKRCFQGKIPGHAGYLLDRAARAELAPEAAVLARYAVGRDLLEARPRPRWIIDFGARALQAASAFPRALARCERDVLPTLVDRARAAAERGSPMAAARREHARRYWQLWNRRDGLDHARARLLRYIGCPRVARRAILVFLDARVCPGDLIQVFAFDDDYSFGILQSNLHAAWSQSSSRLRCERDLRYSVRAVFETFPWPQAPADASVVAVAEAARRLRAARAAAAAPGLRALYRSLEDGAQPALRAAHADLDRAVRGAYGLAAEASQEALAALNHAIAARVDAGEVVTGPGVPASYAGDLAALRSTDRLLADEAARSFTCLKGQA